MNQRGRKSAASLAVVEIDSHGITRIGAPVHLTDGERAVWMATVNSKPAEWFGLEHVSTLVDYARAVVRADVIDAQIKAFEPEWMATDEGLRRYERLIAMGAKLSGVCNTLARSMRITHQALYRANKAATLDNAGKGRKPWQRSEGQPS